MLVAIRTTEPVEPGLQDWLQSHDGRLRLSNFARGEFVSAIANKVRSRVIEEAVAFDLLLAFDTWFAARSTETVLDDDIALATDFVRRFELALRLPDAIHIAISRRLRATLVSLDQRQVRGARAVGVPAFDPASDLEDDA